MPARPGVKASPEGRLLISAMPHFRLQPFDLDALVILDREPQPADLHRRARGPRDRHDVTEDDARDVTLEPEHHDALGLARPDPVDAGVGAGEPGALAGP